MGLSSHSLEERKMKNEENEICPIHQEAFKPLWGNEPPQCESCFVEYHLHMEDALKPEQINYEEGRID